ncbi:hypothetical protein DA075_04580 [Methylobacterium currus]|uniref:Tyr recombinase domain-containing protein n=1 Tax=Methylobacterium currus TaxID=2051553 RepID=A0A2R4WFI5_9HYPH|nr:hypothetical protein [Methylobacterium currus]AWB20300.1 hypothetical protein DA075_04580 [Methylobacterium currus]
MAPDKENDDPLKRLDFDDNDMALVKANLHTFDHDERLLWVLLASTAMRRSEAWDITEEIRQSGIRGATIGSKTPTSERDIPFPDEVLPYLPSRITGCLFHDRDPIRGPINVGKRLMRRIRELGIQDERKVLHSLRHRGITRLREVKINGHGIDSKVLLAIVGHEERTVHDRYGKMPLATTKPWIDLIY